MSEREKLIAWLNSLQNKIVTGADFNVYVPADRTPPFVPMEVAVYANGRSTGKLILSQDGESIAHSSENLKVVSVGSYGASEIRGSIEGADVRRLKGSVVRGADLIIEQGIPIGLELHLSNGSRFLVLNVGDEMVTLIDGDHPLVHLPDTIRENVF